MSISTICPGCGTSYTVGDSMAGKKAKCKKCGAVLTVPNPAAGLEEVPLADLAAGSPLDGLDDRAFGGDPLGPATRRPSPLSSAASPRRAAGAAQGEGVPKWVWIACGVGGGGVLLLLAILVISSVMSGGQPPLAQTGGTDAGNHSTPTGVAPATGTTPATTAPGASGSSPAAVAVDDNIPWKYPAETLPAAPQGLLARPLSLSEGPTQVLLTAANGG